MNGSGERDLRQGVSTSEFDHGAIVEGKVGSEDVLLIKHDDEYFAIGAVCTHYHARLADGLVVGSTIRCPMHHACFSLRTGAALCAPALDPLARWPVEREGDTLFVRDPSTVVADTPTAPRSANERAAKPIVIVGGGRRSPAS